jgi:excisionase family DNA binding protein
MPSMPDSRKFLTVPAPLSESDRTGHLRTDVLELLTVEDVAALLRVSKSWVYEHTRSRGTPRAEKIPHVKIGKYVRFEREAIRAFIRRRSQAV